ncbi:hypothetical protein BJX63DRAFT_384200 [Aspergillus granulosus]|uniref:Uncharacterized protein n=1 Tax=Aspergillus granulosus TaxID=176169 RepID=A0ABR4HSC1_9EURO
MGSSERRASSSPFGGWQHRPGRWFASHSGPTLRPFRTPPPCFYPEFAGPDQYYRVVPFVADRGFNGLFRQSYPECHNRLFLDEYRFLGSHQVRGLP